MRRLGSFVTLLSLCCGTSMAQDLPELKKRGSLRVVVDTSNQPERFNRGAGEPGIEREILQNFAALNGMKLEIVTVERIDDRIPAMLAKRGEVGAGAVVTESRRKQVDFTAEVLPIRHVVVTRKPDAPVTTLDALRSRRVGTTKGSSWSEAALAAGVTQANLDDSYATPEEMLVALKAGRVKAVVMTAIWAILERRKDQDLELGLFIGPPSSVAFAVRKDCPQLRAALDDYVANLRKTATWSRLVVKYFGESALEILKKSRVET
jgi:ABC-type amino acid transport substrate-binding protein